MHINKQTVDTNKFAAQTEVVDNETPEKLQAMIAAYRRQKSCAESSKTRLHKLMARRSATKWDVAKKQRMVRRLSTALDVIRECDDVLDKLEHRLTQIS